RHYQFGQAVKPDRAEAYYWYKRAEAKGNLEAKLFRQLLEKRWNISIAEKPRAEHRLALAPPPKPNPDLPALQAAARTSQPHDPPARAQRARQSGRPQAKPRYREPKERYRARQDRDGARQDHGAAEAGEGQGRNREGGAPAREVACRRIAQHGR